MLYALGRTMYVDCPECRQEVSTFDPGNDVRVIGAIVRLRCVNPDCRHLDWYLESEFRAFSARNGALAIPPAPQPPEKRL